MKQTKVASNLKTEERILSNALQHFCNYGYNGTSVREITAASDVTKPTLYYYFKNKEELFSKLAQSCFGLVISHLQETVTKQDSFEGALKALFNTMNEMVSQNPAALKFIHGVIVAPQRGSPDVGAKSFVESLDSTVMDIVKKAVQKGQCTVGKEKCVHTIILALLGLHTKSLITSPQYDAGDHDRLEAAITAIVGCARNSDCPGH